HPIVLGGPGLVVEIDESKFGRRKYNRGRLVEGHWVFGGVERESGKCFIVEVEDRRENTLLTILQQYVAPGTTIMFDGWASYRRIPDLGMTHLTVIHSRNFVDPLITVVSVEEVHAEDGSYEHIKGIFSVLPRRVYLETEVF
ncbi:Putative LOC101846883, partial [Caligus rogercresseyi]